MKQPKEIRAFEFMLCKLVCSITYKLEGLAKRNRILGKLPQIHHLDLYYPPISSDEERDGTRWVGIYPCECWKGALRIHIKIRPTHKGGAYPLYGFIMVGPEDEGTLNFDIDPYGQPVFRVAILGDDSDYPVDDNAMGVEAEVMEVSDQKIREFITHLAPLLVQKTD